MNHKINLQTIANEIKAAQDHCKLIVPLTSRLSQFSNDKAYAVAQLIHEMRIKEGQYRLVERSDSPTRKCGQFTVCASRFGAISMIPLLFN